MVCISFWCLLVGFSNWFSMLLTDWQKQVETSLFVRCIETTNQLLDLQLPTSTLRASKPAIFWHVQQLKHHMEWCLRIQSIQIMDSQRACPNRSLMTHSPRFGLCESQCASTRLPTTGFWVKRSQMMCIYIYISLSLSMYYFAIPNPTSFPSESNFQWNQVVFRSMTGVDHLDPPCHHPGFPGSIGTL